MTWDKVVPLHTTNTKKYATTLEIMTANLNPSHLLCVALGSVWAWIEPTIPFALLCIFAVLCDCLSAWRLNRRVRDAYGPERCDGKLKSVHMKKMIGDLFMLFSCILIAQGVDQFCIPGFEIYLGNVVAAIFLLTTLVSILENESSCSDAKWAVLIQKYVADKTRRHLNIDITGKDSHHHSIKGDGTEVQSEEEEEYDNGNEDDNYCREY